MGGSTNGDAFIGTGTATVNGTTFNGADIFLDGEFVASNVIVPPEQLFVDVTTPFTFAGTLRATSGGNEILRQALVGSGRAFARLFLDEPGSGFSDESNAIAYNFEPASAVTPEPASMVLLGTGVGSCRPPAAGPDAREKLSITTHREAPCIPPASDSDLSAPFTFTGHVDTFASLTDRDSGASPIAGYDLFGAGASRSADSRADRVGRHAAAGTAARGVHDHQSVRGCCPDAGAGVDAAGGYRHRDVLCPTAKARGPKYCSGRRA